MFETIIVAMATAAVLWLFGLEETLTGAINEVCGKNYSGKVYWLFFAVAGVMLGIVHEITK